MQLATCQVDSRLGPALNRSPSFRLSMFQIATRKLTARFETTHHNLLICFPATLELEWGYRIDLVKHFSRKTVLFKIQSAAKISHPPIAPWRAGTPTY